MDRKHKVWEGSDYIPFILNRHNIDYQNEKAFSALKKPLYSLKESNYLLDSNLNLNLSKKTNSSSIQKVENQILKLLRIIKLNLMQSNEDLIKKKHLEKIIIEWKEAARRLELLFFIVALLTILIAPVALFGKFFFYDKNLNKQFFFNKCGCD